MVYFGPSRGCWTCKRRRKKCDEVKPACMRCINSKRTCGGYAEPSAIIFRHGHWAGSDWLSPDTGKPEPFTSLARKCTLSKRVPFPGTNIWPPDVPPKEISTELFDEYAARSFLWDFCIQPTAVSDARGLFRGLEPILLRQGLRCHLAKAAMAISGESHCRVLNRGYLRLNSQTMYQEVLSYLAKTVRDPTTAKTPETLLLASLLGLYEMIRESETHPEACVHHARGVTAILETENSLCGIVRAARSGHFWETLTGINKPCSVFSFPSRGTTNQCLDDLLLIHQDIRNRSNAVFSDSTTPIEKTMTEIYSLLDEATELEQALARWNEEQPHDLRPSVSGYMHTTRRVSLSSASISSCSGSIAASTVSSSPPPLSEASSTATIYSNPDSSPLSTHGTYTFSSSNTAWTPPSTTTNSPPPVPAPGFWPGRIDTYPDQYMASIWNLYRRLRLTVIDMILQLSERLESELGSLPFVGLPTATRAEYEEIARVLLEDILASIPFHLVEDLHVFIRDAACANSTLEEIPNPGRPAGGLVLMLHLDSMRRVKTDGLVGEDAKEYCKRCLLWIADEMGIGQAAVYANSPVNLRELQRSSWIILGIAMLL